MRSSAIVDSGPLIASANVSDPDHQISKEALATPGVRLVIPALCIAEAAHFIGGRGRASAEARFLRGLRDSDVRAPLPEEWPLMAELVEKYADLGLGTVDASVVILAERLETDVIITLDHRHFRVVRPRHFEAFRLLPAELPMM